MGTLEKAEAAAELTRAGDAASAALERIEEQRAGLTQRQADLEPVLEAAREAVSAAEHSLATLPDPTVLEHDVDAARDAAASAASAVADKRAAAATKARETAAELVDLYGPLDDEVEAFFADADLAA